MKYKKWTEEDKAILSSNYELHGGHYCAELLDRNFDSVKVMASRLGLKGKGRIKTHAEYEMELLERELSAYPLETYKGSNVPIIHTCEKEHTWLAAPNEIRRGKSCPYCSDTSFKLDQPAICYYIKIEDKNRVAYKVGVTNRTLKERFCKDTDKTITTLNIWNYGTGAEALQHERQILKEFEDFRITIPGWLKSKGNTELFSIDIG